MGTHPVEAEVAARLDAGDLESAATALIKAYGGEILGFLVAVLRNVADADEVFSCACEDLWKGLAGFRRECSARTWWYRIAWNAALRFRKSPFVRRNRRLATSEAVNLAAEVVRTSSAPLWERRKDRFDRVRERLEPDEQSLLTLRLDRGLEWAEIAVVMAGDGEALGPAALRKRYERLKSKLRPLIEGEEPGRR